MNTVLIIIFDILLFIMGGLFLVGSFKKEWIKEASRVGAVTHYKRKAFISSLFWMGILSIFTAVIMAAGIIRILTR